jgi:hypothetical protein
MAEISSLLEAFSLSVGSAWIDTAPGLHAENGLGLCSALSIGPRSPSFTGQLSLVAAKHWVHDHIVGRTGMPA